MKDLKITFNILTLLTTIRTPSSSYVTHQGLLYMYAWFDTVKWKRTTKIKKIHKDKLVQFVINNKTVSWPND